MKLLAAVGAGGGFRPAAQRPGLPASSVSDAPALLDTMVTADTVGPRSAVEADDMHILEAAMTAVGVDAGAVAARGPAGATGLTTLARRLDP